MKFNLKFKKKIFEKKSCSLPGWENNDTYKIQNEYHRELIEKFIPSPKDSSLGKYDQCKIKNYTSFENFTINSCGKWVYSREFFKDSMITEVSKFNFKLH